MSPITRVTLLALTFALPACNPVVGADCAEGYARCGRMCIDLTRDAHDCGSCGNECAPGLACVASVCTSVRDAGPPDGGRDAAVRDGGRRDAAQPPVDGGLDAAFDDAAMEDADTDAAVISCDLGERLCGDTCTRPSVDREHCGDCDTVCDATEVCAAGVCSDACDPLTECDGGCVDLTSDPEHCGGCDLACGAGACSASTCEGVLAGHLVVIGHDFERRRTAMSQLLANAVLLGGASPVRVVAWASDTTSASMAGTNAGLEDARGARTYTLDVASVAEEIPLLLESADTFLIYAQHDATTSELRVLGARWRAALRQFLDRGGVVVLLDAPSTTNAGTYQILDSAGLFAATSRRELLSPRLDAVVGRAGDPVLAGVPLTYRGELHTVVYSTTEPDAIVRSSSGPVVFDRVVTP